MNMNPNRVWIEIEHPSMDMGQPCDLSQEELDRIGTERAEAATRMLRRLGILEGYSGKIVFWDTSEKHKGYAWTVDTGGSFLWATAHGHWYNLDWLGRKED